MERLELVYAQTLHGHLRAVAERLRRMADAVGRSAEDVAEVGTSRAPTYATIVYNVQHEVLWGLANLNLDNLVSDASEADRIRAEERATQAAGKD
jgi:hypothetical protein